MQARSGAAVFYAAALLAVLHSSVAVAAPPGPQPKTYTIVIDKMKFGAAPRGLHVGDTILWINRDFLRHSATAGDRSFDVDLPAGKSGRTVLKRTDVIAFTCKFHPGMKGTLLVGR
jgi:plastocyanin